MNSLIHSNEFSHLAQHVLSTPSTHSEVNVLVLFPPLCQHLMGVEKGQVWEPWLRLSATSAAVPSNYSFHSWAPHSDKHYFYLQLEQMPVNGSGVCSQLCLIYVSSCGSIYVFISLCDLGSIYFLCVHSGVPSGEQTAGKNTSATMAEMQLSMPN